MGFVADTYICLDIPSPIAEEVIHIRVQQRDTFRAALPIEITVAGSSGIGVFDETQDEREAFKILDAIAATTSPIHASFKKVIRFPHTDIFVMTLDDEQPFRALHLRIASSPIRFKSSPFPYTPHCTLRSRSPVTEQEVNKLLSLQITGTFVLDTISVYMLDTLPMTCLHRVHLLRLQEENGSGSKEQTVQ